ncbi:MAG TPA: hypothetical protein DCY07_06890 [Rhodospirillaceae bacterium]|nr:hypothetical protein [Rhodospirillaceae bacterium]
MNYSPLKSAFKKSVVATTFTLAALGLLPSHASASECSGAAIASAKPFLGETEGGDIYVRKGELQMVVYDGTAQIFSVSRCPVKNYSEKAADLVNTVAGMCSPDPKIVVDADIQRSLSDKEIVTGLPVFCLEAHKEYPSIPAGKDIRIDIQTKTP